MLSSLRIPGGVNVQMAQTQLQMPAKIRQTVFQGSTEAHALAPAMEVVRLAQEGTTRISAPLARSAIRRPAALVTARLDILEHHQLVQSTPQQPIHVNSTSYQMEPTTPVLLAMLPALTVKKPTIQTNATPVKPKRPTSSRHLDKM
jgi:hypothetical protein